MKPLEIIDSIKDGNNELVITKDDLGYHLFLIDENERVHALGAIRLTEIELKEV